MLLARKSIFDQHYYLQSYQLVFYSVDVAKTADKDAESLLSEGIISCFSGETLYDVLAGKLGFVSFPRNLLITGIDIKNKNLVIDISKDIDVDDQVLEAVKVFKSKGFSLALEFSGADMRNHRLLKFASIIKFDMDRYPPNSLDNIHYLEDHQVKLFAENISEHSQYDDLRNLGFSLFQGDFLSKPKIIEGKKLDSGRQTAMRLLSVVQNDDVEFSSIEAVISSSAVLSYRVFRLINSSSFGFDVPINSLHQAISLLGLDNIRSWISLLVMSGIEDKPDLMCMNALIRAEMCSRLADEVGIQLRGKSLFTAGLISTMDSFLDMHLIDIVQSINVPDWLRETLLEHKGVAGLILNTAILYEKTDFDAVKWDQLHALGITTESIQLSYHDSIVRSADIISLVR